MPCCKIQQPFQPRGSTSAALASVILELEDDPTPLINGLSVEGGGLDGYDPGSSSPTFGAPNLFADSPTSPDRAQDFSTFIATPFERWMQSFGIVAPSALTDTDVDGILDFAKFLFGGDPTNPNSKPHIGIEAETRSISFDVRLGASPAG